MSYDRLNALFFIFGYLALLGKLPRNLHKLIVQDYSDVPHHEPKDITTRIFIFGGAQKTPPKVTVAFR